MGSHYSVFTNPRSVIISLEENRGNTNLTFDMMDETKVNIDQQPPPYPYPQQQPPHMAQYGQMQMVPVVMAPRFGKSPEVRTCINCRTEVMTTVKRSLSQNGWIWSLVLWLFTGCCCFIPCLMDAFHDYAHQCPNCNGIIGKSTPDEREEERKKGLKVVIGTIICYACAIIVLLVIYFSLIFAYI